MTRRAFIPCRRGPLLGAPGSLDVGRGTGYKLRPTVERERLYRLVLELRKEGLSYNQIIAGVKAEHGVTLRKSHMSRMDKREAQAVRVRQGVRREAVS